MHAFREIGASLRAGDRFPSNNLETEKGGGWAPGDRPSLRTQAQRGTAGSHCLASTGVREESDCELLQRSTSVRKCGCVGTFQVQAISNPRLLMAGRAA